MGLLGGLLSGLLAALGLGNTNNSSAAPSLMTVSSVGAAMNQALSQSVTEAGILTSSGIGYAGGVTVSTLGKASSLLTDGFLSAENAIPGLLNSSNPSSGATSILNTLSADGTEAGMAISNYASQMPMNVAKGIADNVSSFPSVPLATNIGGYLFY